MQRNLLIFAFGQKFGSPPQKISGSAPGIVHACMVHGYNVQGLKSIRPTASNDVSTIQKTFKNSKLFQKKKTKVGLFMAHELHPNS